MQHSRKVIGSQGRLRVDLGVYLEQGMGRRLAAQVLGSS